MLYILYAIQKSKGVDSCYRIMNSIKHKEETLQKRTRNGTMMCLVALIGVCSLTAWTAPGINSALAISPINQECAVLGGDGGDSGDGGAGGPVTGGPSGAGGEGGTGGAGGDGDNDGTGGNGGTGGLGGNSGNGGQGTSPGGSSGEGGRGGDGDVTCIIDDSVNTRTHIIQNTLSPKSVIGLPHGIISPIAPFIAMP